jgi:hypothetical protein
MVSVSRTEVFCTQKSKCIAPCNHLPLTTHYCYFYLAKSVCVYVAGHKTMRSGKPLHPRCCPGWQQLPSSPRQELPISIRPVR